MFYNKTLRSENGNFLRMVRTLQSFNFVCKCTFTACSCCGNAPHSPQTCEGNDQWKGLCDVFLGSNAVNLDEMRNMVWIEQNSKTCPKCKVNIQKNEGCMHMTCRNCRHHFCWMCSGDWSTHGGATGGYFSCNLYKPALHDRKKESKVTKDLEVYDKVQFYLKRFQNHRDSCEMMKKRIQAVQVKLNRRSKTHISRWNTLIMPKSLDFYLEAYTLCYEARIFVCNAYPLMMKIKKNEECKLFGENIFFMEMTMENLHKDLIDHPIESLVEILPFNEEMHFLN